jgi:hypothetical protein
MSIELKQAAQQALDAFEAFGEADDFATLFTLTQKMNALRTAIQQAKNGPCKSFTELRERHREGVDAELAAMAAEAKTDVRCEGCGYMTHHREHMGCVRAAKQFTHPATTEPVGQAPSIWNSIQIASWIGSQLMHEPSMFERNAVCKFVRSLGRHPTLLKHSPKDTHPDLGVPDDAVRDAISTVREQYRGTDWGKAAECVCDAIDAAMTASQAQKGQQ